MKVDKIDMNFS